MENLHLKNIEKSQIDIISTNRNYLNSIFKTKNLTFDEFSKKLILHENHTIEQKQQLLEDIYEIYKLNIENYKYITLLIKKYNSEKNSSKFSPEEYINLMLCEYIRQQIIKKILNQEQQKLFYQFINDLTILHNEKYPKHPINTNNEPVQNNYSINLILFICIRKLTKENLINIKPKNLNITLTTNKQETIKHELISNLPKKINLSIPKINYTLIIKKFIKTLSYLNIVTQD